MNLEQLVDEAEENIRYGYDYDLPFTINNITYKVSIKAPSPKNGINIPYISIIPLCPDINNEIMLECNNKESEDPKEILLEGIDKARNLINITRNNPCPIIIPLLPSVKDKPYYQQLSSECFDEGQGLFSRLDEQVVRIIDRTQYELKNIGIDIQDKIFLNGYSASGVFAQRFSLIHPELVGRAVIGGASGSIPIPDDELDYPLGIRNYKELFGKEFNMEAYKEIQFTYYVGEYETTDAFDYQQSKRKNYTDRSLNGVTLHVPMHDMSYFERSVPYEVGKKQRELYGEEMFERMGRTLDRLTDMGVNITHTIISGRTHNNKGFIDQNTGNEILGVNELGEQMIYDTYMFNNEKTHSK